MGGLTWLEGRTHPRQLVRLRRALSNVLSSSHNSNARRTIENCAAGDIELTVEDLADIKQAMTANTIRGTRY